MQKRFCKCSKNFTHDYLHPGTACQSMQHFVSGSIHKNYSATNHGFESTSVLPI